MAFCRNCGTELKEGVKFCTECGAPVIGAAAPSEPEPKEEVIEFVAPQPEPEEETAVQPPEEVEEVQPEEKPQLKFFLPEQENASEDEEAPSAVERMIEEIESEQEEAEAEAALKENICPNCGAEVEPGMKFCTECGKPMAAQAPKQAPTPQENICPHCGAQLEPGMKFCTECGHGSREANARAADTTSSGRKQSPLMSGGVEPSAASREEKRENLPNQHNNPPTTKPPVKATKPAKPEKPTKPEKTEKPAKQPKTVTVDEDMPDADSRYASISMGGWIGILLLLCVPVVGLITAIVWAFGGCRKIVKRNFSRAYLVLTAILLVISLIFGIVGGVAVGGVVKAIEKESGIELNIKDLLGKDSKDNDSKEEDKQGGLLDTLTGLSSLLGGDDTTNSDIKELEDLLEIVGGDDKTSDLINDAIDINKEAEAANDGWPKSLRAYPYGEGKAVASYRTEFTGTTAEEMMAWIEDLKSDGFAYQDFYEFGMTEEDMLSINGWWATDGEIYLSLSYYEGKLTVDHTKELPDMSGMFGE